MLRKRPSTSMTLLAWTVVKTRWPVRADWMAMSAVSASRISPTMILSGSWRRIERSPRAKVSPFFSFTGIWVIPLSWYSTGSSMVMILSSSDLIVDSAAQSVVLLGDRLHGRLEHAVDAVLDHDLGVARLDVDVGGAPVEGVEHRGVHEADDRGGVGLDAVDGEDVFAVVVVAQDLDLEALRGLLQDALRALPALEGLPDGGRGAHRGLDRRLQEQAQLVHDGDVGGVGHDEDEAALLAAVGQEVVAEHELDGHR